MIKPEYETYGTAKRKGVVRKYLPISFYFSIGISVIVLLLIAFVIEDTPLITIVKCCILLSPFIALIFIVGWFLHMRDYNTYVRFENAGLYVLFPLRKNGEFISWNDFQQVCVHSADYGSMGPASTVICFVKHGEKKNGYNRWKVDNIFRYKSVITVQYTPELLMGLWERCPKEIVDLRELQEIKKNPLPSKL